MQFPVVIVDDEETDRLIAKKRFERSVNSGKFSVLEEFESGDRFIEQYCRSRGQLSEGSPTPVLVLMDINMPGRNGFETIEEIARKIEAGDASESIMLMVFTSSKNERDIERAKSLDLVRGYIVKPFEEQDIANILKIMEDGTTEFLMSEDRLA